MSQAYKNKTIWDCLGVLVTECRIDRLFQEDPGVLAPLWFGRDPDSEWHVIANCLRVFIAIPLAPIYALWSYAGAPWKQAVKASVFWKVEWPHVPDAIILEPPGAGPREPGWELSPNGEYAVTNNKPRWLLQVHFKGTSIVSEKQVPYDGGRPDEETLGPDELVLRKEIQDCGYTAISYPMKSAKQMFLNEAKRQLDPSFDAGRELSLENRHLAAHMVLECYAEARTTIAGKADGVEYIWLDEFCLSDARLPKGTQADKREINRQRGLEIGQLADIFRGAKQVVVFCHEPRCDHTDSECAWGKRLFTLGEIMHTEEVLQMTRRPGPNGKLASSITILPGREFRGSMQARAAKEKQWHLYNIMQHSTNSGSVNWQSAIHSLVVEAIRRDEADGFHMHNMLGKGLNGLLPRRSKLEDLQGVDGWADLAWLLELNQGYYNAAALAAVCQIADPWVDGYRWWGKPIRPQEGRERLEPLSTAIPAKFRDEARKTFQPVLSIIGPKSVKVRHMLRRDDSALFRNPDMRILKIYVISIAGALWFIGPFILFANYKVGVSLIYLACATVTTFELLVGTIYVKKDGWVVYEDHLSDPIPLLAANDFSYRNMKEWGNRQLIPRWDVPTKQLENSGENIPRPYRVTLIDLQTGVYTKAMVTGRPNNMVILAVHGGGITCMLLQREEKALEARVSVKVGMANVPPFVLSQSDYSGTVYVGGGALCEKPWGGNPPRVVTSADKTVESHSVASPAISRSNQSETSKSQHSSTLLGTPMSPPSSVSIAPTLGNVSSLPSISLPKMSQAPPSSPGTTGIVTHPDVRPPVDNALPIVQVNRSEAHTSNEDFNPYEVINSGRN